MVARAEFLVDESICGNQKPISWTILFSSSDGENQMAPSVWARSQTSWVGFDWWNWFRISWRQCHMLTVLKEPKAVLLLHTPSEFGKRHDTRIRGPSNLQRSLSNFLPLYAEKRWHRGAQWALNTPLRSWLIYGAWSWHARLWMPLWIMQYISRGDEDNIWKVWKIT